MSKQQAETEQLPPYQTYEDRRNLGDIRVTLDGKPARITGFRLQFAWIQSNDDTVEFCWKTVARVVANGGNFRSGKEEPKKPARQRKPKSTTIRI